MAPQRAGASRIGLVLVLLALVGLASTARLDGDQSLSSSGLASVLMLIALVMAVAIGFGAITFAGGSAIFGGNRRRTNLVGALLITALLAAFLALVLAPIEGLAPRGDVRGARPTRAGRRGEDDTPWVGDETLAIVGSAIAVAALIAAVVVGVVLAVLARRRTVEEPADEEEVVLQAVDESLDDLRRERDVRRAIIACYARMERALERAGSERRPAEAPFEYLVRILERITANGPAARVLTELFERAKFSVEPMGEREKERAIGALELLRAEVSRPL